MNTKLTMPNGEILVVNFYDLDFRERYRTKIEQYMVDINAIAVPDEGDGAGEIAAMRAQIDLSKVFFDDVWGDGTSDRIFGEGVNDLYLTFTTIQSITQMKLDQDRTYADMGKAAEALITDRLGK